MQYIPNPFAGGLVSSFDKYVRRVFLGTLSLVLLFAGIFLLAGHKPLARGIVLGGAVSLLNLVIMAGDVRRQGPLISEKGVHPAYGRYALRLAAITAALIYSATNEKVAFWTTAAALFTSQLVMTGGEVFGRGQREQEPE